MPDHPRHLHAVTDAGPDPTAVGVDDAGNGVPEPEPAAHVIADVPLTDEEMQALRDRYLKGASATVLAVETNVTLPEMNLIVNDRVKKPIYPKTDAEVANSFVDRTRDELS